MNILLVCGGGMSSGFVAQALRRATKKAGYGDQVIARGQTEITDYIDTIDTLLIAPHFAGLLEDEDLMAKLKERNITVMVMDSTAYSMMNGEAILKALLEKKEKENGKVD